MYSSGGELDVRDDIPDDTLLYCLCIYCCIMEEDEEVMGDDDGVIVAWF